MTTRPSPPRFPWLSLIGIGALAAAGLVLLALALPNILRSPATAPAATATRLATQLVLIPTTTTQPPSPTPAPTATPTQAPSPTQGPAAPHTPPPSAAAGATQVACTSPPLNTAVAPTDTPAGTGARGIVSASDAPFRVENTTVAAGADIWFDFKVVNTTNADVAYGALAADTDQ